MKKLIIFLIVPVVVILFIFASSSKPQSRDLVSNISNKIIRFHVVANSDSTDDQSVKLKVRDEILKDAVKDSSKFKTRDEYLSYLKKQIPVIENKANYILKKEGKAYTAKAEVGNRSFPVKSYSSITLPAGTYMALNVTLGKGDGKNWWCVMFPPLCFIDITRGLTTNETDTQLKKVLDDDTVQSITVFQNDDKGKKNVNASTKTVYDSTSNDTGKIEPNVEFRFKSVEIISDILNKIKKNFFVIKK